MQERCSRKGDLEGQLKFHHRSSYLGRAVATAGEAAHRLACRTGVATTAAAAEEARVVFVFVAAAEGVAARREARMMEGEKGWEENWGRKKIEVKEKALGRNFGSSSSAALSPLLRPRSLFESLFTFEGRVEQLYRVGGLDLQTTTVLLAV